MLDEAFDVADESLGAGEGTSANSLLSNEAEPAFDLVEPGRIGWGEMQVVARTPSEPSADAVSGSKLTPLLSCLLPRTMLRGCAEVVGRARCLACRTFYGTIPPPLSQTAA